MSLLMNQYGHPIILFDVDSTKERLKGKEAYQVIILYINIPYIEQYSSSMWCS